MKKPSHPWAACLCVAALSLGATSPAAAEAPADWNVRSRELADQLMGELKAELGKSMQSGGPVAAIDVCRSRAPEIASRLSAASGAKVKRTARRVRNATNAPDPLELEVLAQFEQQLAAAATAPPAAPPETFFDQRTPAGVEHRYMRAIVTQPVCVTCHGKAIAPEVAAAISRAYPDDAATGFEPGQLRGAVSIVWPAGH